MTSINEFCEVLDHEFRAVEPLTDIEGIKIDGEEGLKVHCKAGKLRSVDYLITLKGEPHFIEFSDITGQINDLLNEKSLLNQALREKDANEDKSARTHKRKLLKKLSKDRDQKVRYETGTKYKDTYLLFLIAPNYLSDVPALAEGCPLLVIYSDLESHCDKQHPTKNFSNNEHEIMRFMDYLEDSVVDMIPDAMFKGVKFLSLSEFKRDYLT